MLVERAGYGRERKFIYALYYDSSKEQYQIPCPPIFVPTLFNDIFFSLIIYLFNVSNVAPTRHVLKW